MKTTNKNKRSDNPSRSTSRAQEQQAAQKPIVLNVEVLEERIAPGFLSLRSTDTGNAFRLGWQPTHT